MGWFSKRQEEDKVILPEGARCSRCGKKIKEGQEFVYIKKKLYCENCYRTEKDWEFLDMVSLFEDD